MSLFEYFTAKLAKKGLIPSEVLTNHTSKSIAYEFVKTPFTILKTVVVGILKWGLWVFNELVPAWVRIALFLCFCISYTFPTSNSWRTAASSRSWMK